MIAQDPNRHQSEVVTIIINASVVIILVAVVLFVVAILGKAITLAVGWCP